MHDDRKGSNVAQPTETSYDGRKYTNPSPAQPHPNATRTTMVKAKAFLTVLPVAVVESKPLNCIRACVYRSVRVYMYNDLDIYKNDESIPKRIMYV